MLVYSIYDRKSGELLARGTAQELVEQNRFASVRTVENRYYQTRKLEEKGGHPRTRWEREGRPERPGPRGESRPEKRGDIGRMNTCGTSRKERLVARLRQDEIAREVRRQQKSAENAERKAKFTRRARPEGNRTDRTRQTPHPARAKTDYPPPPLRPGMDALDRDVWQVELGTQAGRAKAALLRAMAMGAGPEGARGPRTGGAAPEEKEGKRGAAGWCGRAARTGDLNGASAAAARGRPAGACTRTSWSCPARCRGAGTTSTRRAGKHSRRSR